MGIILTTTKQLKQNKYKNIYITFKEMCASIDIHAKRANLSVPKIGKIKCHRIDVSVHYPSDTPEFCKMILRLSQEEIYKHNTKLKEQISNLTAELKRGQCIVLINRLLEEFPDLNVYSQDYLSKTSPRYQNLFPENEAKTRTKTRTRTRSRSRVNSQSAHRRRRSHSKAYERKPRSQSTGKPTNESLSKEQIMKDTDRLHAHLNFLTANMILPDNLRLIQIMFELYPELRELNNCYLRKASPRFKSVFNAWV